MKQINIDYFSENELTFDDDEGEKGKMIAKINQIKSTKLYKKSKKYHSSLHNILQ